MNLCNNRHDEICYEAGDCPLCAAKAEADALSDRVASLTLQLETAQEECEDLRQALREAK